MLTHPTGTYTMPACIPHISITSSCMLSAQVAPLCCASRSIPSFTACFVCCTCVCCRCARPPGLPACLARLACVPCIQHRSRAHELCTPGAPTSLPAHVLRMLHVCVCAVAHARLVCLPPSPPWPACRASSIGPELMRCARPGAPVTLPARLLRTCSLCVLLLRTPACSACLPHPPGLRAVHLALVQSSRAVHAQVRPPSCPPACFVCCTCVCCCTRPPVLPACLTHLACVPCIQHWSRAHALCTPGAPVTLPACLSARLLRMLHVCVLLHTPAWSARTLTCTCLPVWYERTSCAIHHACSAYPALAHYTCAAHVL
jgi:hypothetical protein